MQRHNRDHGFFGAALMGIALFTTFLALPATPAAAQQAVRIDKTPGPAISAIRIEVRDARGKQRIGEFNPGETLRLEVGDVVQLRLLAIPEVRQRNPIYPSAQYQAWSGKARIDLANADERSGTVEVRAVRADNPGKQDATTMIRFDATGDINMPERRRGGYLTIEVVGPEPEPEPEPEPVAPPPNERGITLYEHQDFHGVGQKFTSDVRDLRGTGIQQDRASSVRIDRGCKATLYEHPNFGGRATVVTEDIVDLRETRVGSDTVSSLTIECLDPGEGGWPGHHDHGRDRDRDWDRGRDDDERGVTLYEHQDFRGESETFSRDVRDLRGTRIRQDRASSVTIDRGCEAVLYEHPDFEGRATVVTDDIYDLHDTRVGNDTVSSLEVNCRRR